MSKRLQKKIQAQLTPDLLHRKYRHLAAEHPHAGHCYAATEALYHALGAEGSGWRPVNIQWEGSQHWFLQHKKTGKVLDPTAGQFSKPVPYEHGRARGFLTKHPSKRAQEIMKRAKLNESNWFAPDFEKEKGEFERVSRETGIHIDKLKGAFAKGKLAPLSPDHFASLENTDANTGEYKTVDSVHHMAQSYGGKDSQGIHRGLTQGERLPAPIVLHRKGKSPTLVAGNTRLTMATVMNQPVHAVHINVDESWDGDSRVGWIAPNDKFHPLENLHDTHVQWTQDNPDIVDSFGKKHYGDDWLSDEEVLDNVHPSMIQHGWIRKAAMDSYECRTGDEKRAIEHAALNHKGVKQIHLEVHHHDGHVRHKTVPNPYSDPHESRADQLIKLVLHEAVFRVDPAGTKIDPTNLRTYHRSPDWTQSGAADPADRPPPGMTAERGLFAGSRQDASRYAAPRDVSWVSYKHPDTGRPTIAFAKSDEPRVRANLATLSRYPSSRFQSLPSGERFSSNPGSPVSRQTVGAVKLMQRAGHDVKFVDDLHAHHKLAQKYPGGAQSEGPFDEARVLGEGVVLSGEPGSKRLMTVAMQYGYQETGEPEVTKTAVVHKLIDPKTGYQLQVRRLLQRDRGLDLDQNIWQHSPTNDLGTDPEHLTQVLRLATRNARVIA